MIPRTQLKYLRSLRQKKVRAREGLLLVEGLRVVEEAVAHGQVREFYLGEAAAAGERAQAVAQALARKGLTVNRLTPRDVKALAVTRAPAGIFALVENPCRSLRADDLPAEGLVLLAAGVADPGNLGTLIRTAAALGAAAVVTTAGSVEPTNPKSVRATAGAIFRLPVRRGSVGELESAGYALYAADARGEPVDRWKDRPARLALAIGNEPRGVADEIGRRAAGALAVPLQGGVESLNVAVAAGILLHALRALPVTR